MSIIKAPGALSIERRQRPVFLAGSIDMGAAPNWQQWMEEALSQLPDVVVLNPRRDDWDSSWVQRKTDDRFRQQVEWELDAMERSEVIAVNFSAGSYAPITLLELGLNAKSEKLIVCCPDGYQRKGNVEIVCERHGIHVVETLPALVGAVAARLTSDRARSA